MNVVESRRSSVASTSILEAPSCQSWGDNVREYMEDGLGDGADFAGGTDVDTSGFEGACLRWGTRGATAARCAWIVFVGNTLSSNSRRTGVFGPVVGGVGNREMLMALSATQESRDRRG